MACTAPWWFFFSCGNVKKKLYTMKYLGKWNNISPSSIFPVIFGISLPKRYLFEVRSCEVAMKFDQIIWYIGNIT